MIINADRTEGLIKIYLPGIKNGKIFIVVKQK